MLTAILPKLPMRNKAITKDYYLDKLGFELFEAEDYEAYLIIRKDQVQIHFFAFESLNTTENYGQVYIRVTDIEQVYQEFLEKNVPIHPNGILQTKPWGQREFSLLDPDHNLLTFGEAI